jgi:hypothetical protein
VSEEVRLPSVWEGTLVELQDEVERTPEEAPEHGNTV